MKPDTFRTTLGTSRAVRGGYEHVVAHDRALGLASPHVRCAGESKRGFNDAGACGCGRLVWSLHPGFHRARSQNSILLRQLADLSVALEFVEQILTSFPDLQLEDKGIENLVEPLTRREIAVLALLAERQTNKEIAHRLLVSSLMVRKHTSNISQKLGVRERREAVAAAEVIGILKT